jgi:hypothetical protein
MGAIEIHLEYGGAGQDLAGRMGAESANGLESDFEKSGWIRQYTFVHQRVPELFMV